MDESKLTSLIRRALVSRGRQQVDDLREALRLSIESSGAETKSQPNAAPEPGVLNQIEGLRAMLNDPGVKGNGKAVARICKWIKELR